MPNNPDNSPRIIQDPLLDNLGADLLDASGNVLTSPLVDGYYSQMADGVDRLTGTYIFPGCTNQDRYNWIVAALEGRVQIQTQAQATLLAINLVLPGYYRGLF